MTNPITTYLDRTSMYRVVLHYLVGLLAIAFVGGAGSLVAVDPANLVYSLVILGGVCWIANAGFARLYHVPVNSESVWITALILALVMPPIAPHDGPGLAGLALAASTAIASKFILAVDRKHVFNPVAVGAVAASFLVDQPATWWVDSNPLLLAGVLAGGILVVWKIRRADMVLAYLAANVVLTLATTPREMLADALTFSVLYAPLFFAGFAMLTEPLTAPQERWPRIAYGLIVGALSAPNVHFGSVYLTPEMALLVGNAFALAAGHRGRVRLTLLRIEKTAAGSYDYVFAPDRRLRYRAGQYLDWTLAVDRPDDRGNRRAFTVASAPGEDEVRLGVRFYRKPSSFKRTLASLTPGAIVYGSHGIGGFTLPPARDAKFAFIAGGIGVTPFRAIVRDMIDRNDARSAVLIYGSNRIEEIAYRDVFEEARQAIGLDVFYAVAEAGESAPVHHRGYIDRALIERAVPDFAERIFYLSGPRAMVVVFRRLLRELGVPSGAIRTDDFPGFA